MDVTLASIVLQVVGGREYEVVLLAETIRSLDHVTRKTDRSTRPKRNETFKPRRNTSSAFIDGVHQNVTISQTLLQSRVAHHPGHLSPRMRPSKPSSLTLGLKGTASARRSPRRMNSLSISADVRESSSRLAPRYRDVVRSWRDRTLPWRGPGRGLVEVHTHPRIDISTRPSPGTGAFHGDGRLHLGRGGRPI
ncbi:hypothetical protein CRG98_030631 [Punica granatum]|uniref:Uncharacterized protein n=1 Tax=Punica granatum TaxID=22663 RepID=A0A2I0IY90_PUNGR|nr:hypothetical protein CRG98_030631 [Punica granatum]